jgi:folate-binding protein YgfZ
MPDDFLTEYTAAHDHAVLFDVSERGKVEVIGADAGTFLHNLSTNDIKNLAVGRGCEAFLTTAQARVVAHLWIYHVKPDDGRDAYQLDVAPGLAERVIKHLDHYIISEQVELADRTLELAQFHLAGPEARSVLERATEGGALNLDDLQLTTRAVAANITCQVRQNSPLSVTGYDILCQQAHAQHVQQALTTAGARPARPEVYNVLRIEAGTPAHGAEIDDNRLVMELGRTARAICYTKGCFLGQEPIVMARDRGHANRTLLGVRLASGGLAEPGTKLFREGKEVGQVTSSVASPRLGAIGLAYIRRGNQEPGTIVEVGEAASKRTAEVVSLPFSSLGASMG